MKARRFLLTALLSVVGCVFAIAGCGETVDDGHQHDYEWEITTPATCQQEGERKGTCKICGYETTETLSKTAHTLEGEPTVITPSTCTTKGSGTKKCSVCGTEQPVELELAPHNMTHHEEVRATCETDGSIEYWSCSECGLNYTDEKGTNVAASVTVPKETVPHQYDERGVCTVCGEHNPDASQHICTPVLVNEIPADCKTEGVKEHYECKECGKVYKDADGKEETTLEALKIPVSTDHNAAANAVHYDEVISKSCLQYGKKERWDCKVCGRHFKTAELKPEDEYVEVGEDGVCSEKTLQNPKSDIHADANGKGTWDYFGDTSAENGKLEPTCTKVGWEEGVYVCSVCGLVFREKEFDTQLNKAKPNPDNDNKPYEPLNREDVVIPINPANHSTGDKAKHHNQNNAKPESCGNSNVTYKVDCYECAYCGKFFKDADCKEELDREDVLNFGEHIQLEEENAVESTCNTHGHPHCWTCKSCGEHFDTAKPAPETEPLSEDAYNLPYASHAFSVIKYNSQGHWYACKFCGADETDEDGFIKMEDHIIEEGDDDECQVCGYGNVDLTEFFEIEENDGYATIKGLKKDDEDGYLIGNTEETVLRLPEMSKMNTPITEIGAGALSNYESYGGKREYEQALAKITEIVIPATITKVGDNAFRPINQAYNITKITFESGENVVEFGASVFQSMTCLKEIVLPKKIKSFASYMLTGCTNLKKITMPEEVTDGIVGQEAFSRCTSLETIDLWCLNPGNGSKTYYIDDSAFYYCTGVKEIYLPKGLTTMRRLAFAVCTSVEKIHFGGTEAEWKAMVSASNSYVQEHATGDQQTNQYWNWMTPNLQNYETNNLMEYGVTK